MKDDKMSIVLASLALSSMLAVPSYAKAEVLPQNLARTPGMVAVADSSLGIIEASIRNYTTEYKKLPTKYDLATDKAWSINFNNAINLKKFSQENVKVIDEMGVLQNVTFEVGKTNKTLLIKAPREGYEEGKTYAILLLKDKGNGLHNFKESTVSCFTIKKSSTGSGGTTTPSTNAAISISKVEAGSTVLWQNEAKSTLDAYKPVTLDNLFDKAYIPVYRQQDRSTLKWYGNTIPYHLIDQKAYDNIDVYPLKEVAKGTNQLTITFDKEIDPSSVNTDTVKLKQYTVAETGDWYSDFDQINVSCSGNKLIVYLPSFANQQDGKVRHLLINGVKLQGAQTIAKPTIMPFLIQEDSTVSVLSTSDVLPSTYDAETEDIVQGNTGLKFTRFEYGFVMNTSGSRTRNGGKINGFHVAQLAQTEYPDYAPIFKEINNRAAKYDLLYWDVFESKDAAKQTGLYRDSFVIWDRLILNGYNADVLYDGNKLNVVIYAKGTEGFKSPNLVSTATFLPFLEDGYPDFVSTFNFPVEYKFSK